MKIEPYLFHLLKALYYDLQDRLRITYEDEDELAKYFKEICHNISMILYYCEVGRRD